MKKLDDMTPEEIRALYEEVKRQEELQRNSFAPSSPSEPAAATSTYAQPFDPNQTSAMAEYQRVRGNPKEQGWFENVARGIASVPPGVGALAQAAGEDPMDLIKTVARETYGSYRDAGLANIPTVLLPGIGHVVSGLETAGIPTGRPDIPYLEPEIQRAQKRWQTGIRETPVETGLEIAAMAGAPAAAARWAGRAGTLASKVPLRIPYADKLRGAGKVLQGAASKFANPLGTPEVVLKDLNIVDPFIKNNVVRDVHLNQIYHRVENLLGDVKEGSPHARAIIKALDDPASKLSTPRLKGLREELDYAWRLRNKGRVERMGNTGNKATAKLLRMLDDENVAPEKVWEYFQSAKDRKKTFGRQLAENFIPYRKGYFTHEARFGDDVPTVAGTQQGISTKGIVELQEARSSKYMKRTGKGMAKQNLRDTIKDYMSYALNDYYTGRALHKSIPNVEALQGGGKIITRTADGSLMYNLKQAAPGSKRAYAEAFIRRQLDIPTASEEFFKNLFNWSPKAQRKTLQAITSVFYKSLIGMAFDTGFKNITQGINTFSELGLTPSLKGYGKLLTESMSSAGRKGMSSTLLGEVKPLLEGGETLKISNKALKKFDDIVLSGPMQFAEYVNRGAAYHGAFEMFIKKGTPIEKAHEMALKMVRKTQFAYGKTNISPYLQGWMRPFYQFFSFPTKQAELMWSWVKEGKKGVPKLLRYFATTGALVYGSARLGVDLGNVFFNPVKFVDPESDEGIAVPGIKERVKFDPLGMLTSGPTPQSWKAPIISVPQKVLEATQEEDPAQRDRKLAKSLITGLAPGGRYGYKLYEIAEGLQGKPVLGKRNRVSYYQEAPDMIAKALGMRRTEVEAEQNLKTRIHDALDDFNKMRQQAMDALLAGDSERFNRYGEEATKRFPWWMDYWKNYFSDRNVENELQRKQQTSTERFFNDKMRLIMKQAITGGQP